MHMIGHQHIGVDGQALLLGGFPQTAEVKPVILVRREDRLPVVAALDDVQRLARQEEAGKACLGVVPNGDVKGDFGVIRTGAESYMPNALTRAAGSLQWLGFEGRHRGAGSWEIRV